MRSRRTMCSDLRQTMRSPSRIGIPTWPSTLRYAFSLPVFTTISICDESLTTNERWVKECGETGVMTNALTDGVRIGPPAASEYAVEPVGVDTMRLSAL